MTNDDLPGMADMISLLEDGRPDGEVVPVEAIVNVHKPIILRLKQSAEATIEKMTEKHGSAAMVAACAVIESSKEGEFIHQAKMGDTKPESFDHWKDVVYEAILDLSAGHRPVAICVAGPSRDMKHMAFVASTALITSFQLYSVNPDGSLSLVEESWGEEMDAEKHDNDIYRASATFWITYFSLERTGILAMIHAAGNRE